MMYSHKFGKHAVISAMLSAFPSVCRSQGFYESSETQDNFNNSNFLANATQIVLPIISCIILFLAVCWCLRETLCKRSPDTMEHCTPTEIKPLRLPFQEHYFGNQLWDLSSRKSYRKLTADNRKYEAGIVVIPSLLSHSLFFNIEESRIESDTNSLLCRES